MLMKNIPLFKRLSEAKLQALEAACVARTYPKNVILFIEGEEHTNLYIIKKGKICIYANDDQGNQVTLNYMTEGEYFGELALLDQRAHSASAASATPCELLQLSKASFNEIVMSDPASMRIMLAELSQRAEQGGSDPSLRAYLAYFKTRDEAWKLRQPPFDCAGF